MLSGQINKTLVEHYNAGIWQEASHGKAGRWTWDGYASDCVVAEVIEISVHFVFLHPADDHGFVINILWGSPHARCFWNRAAEHALYVYMPEVLENAAAGRAPGYKADIQAHCCYLT